MGDLHQVVTPENVELEYEIAGIGSRFLAIIIDVLIQSLFMIGIYYGLTLIGLEKLDLDTEIANFSTSFAGAALLLLMSLIWLGYYIILETAMNGQTIGKRLVNIRVRKELGFAPNFWDILLRNLIRLIDFLPFLYAFGFITMFLNKKAKRLGDFAAGTIVVKELPRKRIKNYLQTSTERANYSVYNLADARLLPEKFPWADSLVARLSQKDYFYLQNLYSRRNELTNFQQLAQETVIKIIRRNPDLATITVTTEEAGEIIFEMLRIYEKAHFG
jgi:uncharacterized RDD family membrane protein YckC